jgi:quinol---cytochrome-c reductase cytochrome c subunit
LFVKFLSTRRRHPLAGLLVVLLGLVFVGGVYSAFRPAVAEGTSSDTAMVEAGRKLFVVGCASCHGLNGEGIVTKRGTNFGPALTGVGAAAVDFQVGTGRMPLAVPGRQAIPKPPNYTAKEISELAAYVASLGPGPAIPGSDETDVSNATTAEIVEGGQFFKTNCTACHNYAAEGGALPSGGYAPPLLDTSSRHIIEAMLTGPGQMPRFSDEVVTPAQKRDILAYITTLKTQPNYGGSNLGSRGPVTEGLWGWLGGMGALVLAAVWIGNQGVRAGKKKRS